MFLIPTKSARCLFIYFFSHIPNQHILFLDDLNQKVWFHFYDSRDIKSYTQSDRLEITTVYKKNAYFCSNSA